LVAGRADRQRDVVEHVRTDAIRHDRLVLPGGGCGGFFFWSAIDWTMTMMMKMKPIRISSRLPMKPTARMVARLSWPSSDNRKPKHVEPARMKPPITVIRACFQLGNRCAIACM